MIMWSSSLESTNSLMVIRTSFPFTVFADTITGTSKNDKLTGTQDADRISGPAGNDFIEGLVAGFV
jgi:Ca2+-binding RTX toxin-like protein